MGIQCGSFLAFYYVFAKWETENLTVWSICCRDVFLLPAQTLVLLLRFVIVGTIQ